MNPLIENFAAIRKLLQRPELELHVQESWGSQNPDHRKMIADHYLSKNLTPAQVSVSHSRNLGGYLADPSLPRLSTKLDVEQPLHNAIGFDLEKTARVLPHIAERISHSPEEFSAAPSPASLWTAKEACFKALRGPRQPQVLYDILVGEWIILPSQIETVRFISCQDESVASAGFGVVIHQNLHTFSLFSFGG